MSNAFHSSSAAGKNFSRYVVGSAGTSELVKIDLNGAVDHCQALTGQIDQITVGQFLDSAIEHITPVLYLSLGLHTNSYICKI